MNRRNLWWLVVVAGLLFWWFSQPVAVLPTQIAPLVTPVQPQPVVQAKAEQQGTQLVEVKEQLPEELQQSFALVAQSYAAEVAAPAYARPLTVADVQLLQPNQFFAQSIPVAGGGSIRLEASQYRFSYPEQVRVSLVSSGIALTEVQVQLVALQQEKVLITAALQGLDGRYDAVLSPEPDWDGELEVRFSFEHQGEQQQLQTAIEYSQPVAEITAVGSPSAVGADLVIPLHISVKQAGFYRLRANLFSQTQQPLAQLTATDKLGSGPQQLQLKVHKTVLAGRAGPYWLKTFVLEKMSASPAEPTRYGKSAEPEYAVEYMSLDALSDEPVEMSAEEQQRLELLQKLAGQ